MDPPKPVPGVGDGTFLEQLPVDGIDAIVETGLPPLLTLEIRQLGGALARPSPSHGAVGSLAAEFVMFAAGLTPSAPSLPSSGRSPADAATAPHTRSSRAQCRRRGSDFGITKPPGLKPTIARPTTSAAGGASACP
jgi:hypothetical protein